MRVGQGMLNDCLEPIAVIGDNSEITLEFPETGHSTLIVRFKTIRILVVMVVCLSIRHDHPSHA